MKQSVLAVDLRNHGVSPHHHSHKYEELAEDVLELMNKLEINKAFIIGHSMGGRTGISISLLAVRKFSRFSVGYFCCIVRYCPSFTCVNTDDIRNTNNT